MIRPYLSAIIIDYENQEEWKTNLTMSTNFISSKDSDETRYLRTKSNNIEIMMGNETDEIIDEIFEYFFTKLSKRFRRINERKQFNFCSFYLLYYHLQKISLKSGGSHIDSPEWLKNKKATINPKINDGNCFQYALIIALTTLSKH